MVDFRRFVHLNDSIMEEEQNESDWERDSSGDKNYKKIKEMIKPRKKKAVPRGVCRMKNSSTV